MFCSKCGNQVEGHAKFCSHCGSEMTNNNEVYIDNPIKQEDPLNSTNILRNTNSLATNILRFNKKSLTLIAVSVISVIAIAIASQSNNNVNSSLPASNEQTDSNAVVGDGLDVKLERVKFEDNNFCTFYFDIANHTKMNITGGMISVIEKDSGGTIMDKGYIQFTNGIKQNANTSLDMYVSNCSSIASLDLKALEALMVDGEFATGINDGDVPLHSGSDTNIPVNSLAGGIKAVNPSTVASSNPQLADQDSGSYEKLDSGVMAMKYASNPFEVRKSLGKKYETEIFTDKFIDEGSTALIIDGNFGFYCRMKGDEFGQHNQRGTMVVRGVLAESDGRIGLDHCIFVSNGSDNSTPADSPAASDSSDQPANN